MKVEKLITKRAKTHGDFQHVARVADNLISAMMDSPNWGFLPSTMKITMIFEQTKNARILCGDFNELDHWRDKQGYSQLILDEIET